MVKNNILPTLTPTHTPGIRDKSDCTSFKHHTWHQINTVVSADFCFAYFPWSQLVNKLEDVDHTYHL